MRLPIPLLQRIIGKPVAHFEGSGHKRAVGRVSLRTRATVYPLHGDLLEDPLAVNLNDISAETIGYTAFRAFMPFSSMVITIPINAEGGAKSVQLRCRVMNCTRISDGRFRVAAMFLGIWQVRVLAM
jgi:hypothetical protein